MLLFSDSFEHYSLISDKWTAQRGSTGATMDAVTGRFGTGWNMNSRYLTKGLAGNYGTLIMGFAMKPTTNAINDIASFNDGGSRTDVQCAIRYDAGTGTWYAMRATTVLATSAPGFTIPNGSFGYVEWKATIHNSTGSVQIRLNGQVILTVTGVDTSNSGTTTANTVLLGSWEDGSAAWTMDDVYVLDTTDSGIAGAPNNDYLGDIRVEALYPNAVGTTNNFARGGTDSGANWSQQDENPNNGDTDYVESLTVGDKDTYNFTNLASTSGSVYGIGVYPMVKKTDAGSRGGKATVRLSAVEQDGPEFFPSSGYGAVLDYRNGDPSGNQWTIANVNALEAGLKVTS